MAAANAKSLDKSKNSGKRKNSTSSSSSEPSKKRKYDGKKFSAYPKKSSSSATATMAKETPSNKKRALKAERQSHRRHAAEVRSAKEIWNDLRVKTNDAETNAKLCAELRTLLQGKLMEAAMQHDASRCVQGLIQFGNEEMRREVVTELCEAGGNKPGGGGEKKGGGGSVNNLAELCKIQYAHFVVLKMIKYCGRDETCVKLIVKSLKKQMTKLAVHSVGSRVVELLFATFPPKSTSPLKLELYGPQYALFATAVPPSSEDGRNKNASLTLPSLAAFIESNPDKLEPTLTHLQSLLQKGLDKSLTGFAYFHSLLLDYASIASPNDIRSFLAPALAEHSLHLLSTRTGTKVVCECIAYATVKDRKKMIKCLKGYTRSSLLHRDAYLAILRMCDVMDDTVLVNKMLLAELHKNPDSEKQPAEEEDGKEGVTPSPILDLVLSDTGSKLFLLLLVSKEEEAVAAGTPLRDDEKSNKTTPRWQKYLDPYELSVLHRDPTVTEHGELVTTSKKSDEARRLELVVYLKDLLMEVCTKHAGEIMRSKSGSRVLCEVCESYPGDELFDAIVEACEGDDVGDSKGSSMLEDPVGHLTIKHIFLSESKRELEDGEPSLALAFFSKFKNRLGDIAKSNRGAFVLSALMHTGARDEVRGALKAHEKSITKLAKGGSNDGKKLAGCGVLLEALKA